MWKATLRCNFSFEAYGPTRDAATDALIDGLVKHAEQYHLSPDWYCRYLDDSVVVAELVVGRCYRDRELLPSSGYVGTAP